RALLTAALTRTSGQSFTFTASAATHADKSRPAGTSTAPPQRMTGSFDPVSGNGTETITSPGRPALSIRVIGQSEYVAGSAYGGSLAAGKPWVKFRAQPRPSGAPALTWIASGFAGNQPLTP